MMTDQQRIRKIRYGVMHNDPQALQKSLWRLAQGSMSRAYAIIRDSAPHWGLPAEEVTDTDIEIALSELNDGVEVEWATP